MKLKKKTIGFMMIMSIILSASAVRVGVVVEFPDGTVTSECIETPAGTDGYQLMRKINLDIAWSDGGVWGHGLCGINGTGCPSDNCYCSTEEYWSFHTLSGGTWNYMPVGWDAGDNCWNGDVNSYVGHYCTQEGDVLGYAYGPWGTKPAYKRFDEICLSTAKPKKERDVAFTGGIAGSIIGKDITLTEGEVSEFSLQDKRTGEKVLDVIVEVRNERLEKLFTVEADEDGKINLSLKESGEYRLLVMAHGYPHKQMTLTVEKQQTTTSSPSTTTSIVVTASSTSTTTKLAHFTDIDEETTTLTPETTTLTTTSSIESATTEKSVGEISGNVVAENPGKTPGNMNIIIIAAVLLGALLYARRK